MLLCVSPLFAPVSAAATPEDSVTIEYDAAATLEELKKAAQDAGLEIDSDSWESLAEFFKPEILKKYIKARIAALAALREAGFDEDAITAIMNEPAVPAEQTVPEENTAASMTFTDLPDPDTWQYAGIAFCVKNHIMSGMSATVFSPDGTLTRGQLVTVLYRIAGKPEVANEKVFTDVASDKYYTVPIIWAAKRGIVNGFEDGTFRPDAPITRAQAATILYRYSGSPAVSGDLSAFPDAAAVQSYSRLPMLWAIQNGFLPGITEKIATQLAPRTNVAREQIASFIMRYLESK